MRAIILFVLSLVLAACAHVGGIPAEPASPLRVMTFNIRLDLASDGPNAWPHRKHMVAEIIRHEAPGLLGMQEVLLHQKTDLRAALPGYTFVGVARDDGLEKGEFSPLAFLSDRFELLQTGTFWLSSTPAQPGKAWDAAFPRIATWAILRERTGGQRLAVLNTHFDHVGTEARANSASMIASWARQHAGRGDAVIVLGDFNAVTASPPMALLGDASRSGLRLARAVSATPPYGPPGTFNAFKIDADTAEPIDHVLVSARFDVLRFATITQHWGGRLPSDHYPVVADLAFRR